MYTSFLLILVGFLEKWTKSANLGNFGVLRYGVRIPRNNVGPHQGVACPRRGVAERRLGQALGTPRRSEGLRRGVALFTDMCFCRVLLFRYFEDLSSRLMRTL